MCQRVAEFTKQNIQEAFWKLYAKGGMAAVSVTKICSLAGYNRSTFYAYFKDIYEVLDTIEAQLITPEEFENQLLLPLMCSNDETVLLHKLITFFDLHSPYLPILLGEYGDPHYRQKLLSQVTPLIQKRLHVPAHFEKQFSYILEYQNAAVFSTITKWYANEKDIPEEELIDMILRLTTKGVKMQLMKLTKQTTK